MLWREYVAGRYVKYKWNVFSPFISLCVLGCQPAPCHPTNTYIRTPPDAFVCRVESTLLIVETVCCSESPKLYITNSNTKDSACQLRDEINDIKQFTQIVNCFSPLCWEGRRNELIWKKIH